MKKALAVILLLGAIGAGVWYYQKSKKSSDPVITDEATDALPSTIDDTPAKSLEEQSFERLGNILKADPVWLNQVFPADFYEAVVLDYDQQKKGNPRTPDYAYGKPGSFMSVSDAWKQDMDISDDTHAALWQEYSNFRSEWAKSQL